MIKFLLPILFLLSACYPAFADTPGQIVNVTCTGSQWVKAITPNSASCVQINYSNISGVPTFIKADGTVPMAAALNMASHKLTNVTDPTSAQDAATKAYVDSSSGGGLSVPYIAQTYSSDLAGSTDFMGVDSLTDTIGALVFGTTDIPSGDLTHTPTSVRLIGGSILDSGNPNNAPSMTIMPGYTYGTGVAGDLTLYSGSGDAVVNVRSANPGAGTQDAEVEIKGKQIELATMTVGSSRGHVRIKDGSEGTSGQCLVSTDNSGTSHWGSCGSSGSFVKTDGTTPLTGNWDVGGFKISNTANVVSSNGFVAQGRVDSDLTLVGPGLELGYDTMGDTSVISSFNRPFGSPGRGYKPTLMYSKGLDIYYGDVGGGDETKIISVLSTGLDLVSHQIHNVVDPSSAQDAATKNYVDTSLTSISGFVKTDGSTPLTGNWDTGSFVISNFANLIGQGAVLNNFPGGISGSALELGFTGGVGVIQAYDRDAGSYLQSQIIGNGLDFRVGSTGSTSSAMSINGSGVSDWQGNALTNLADPTNPQDAATKAYVDSSSGGSGANVTLSNLTSPTAINENLIFATGGDFVTQTANDSIDGRTGSLTIKTGNNSLDPLNSGTKGTGNLTVTTGLLTNGGDGQGSTGSMSFVSGGITGGSQGGSASGDVTVGSGDNSGFNASGPSGALTLKTGATGSGSQSHTASGDINIKTGNSGASLSTGNIILQTGTGGSGSGSIQFKNSSEGTSGDLWTSTDSSGSGHWATLTGYVKTNGSTPLTANWDVGGFQLKNLAAPTSTADAVTKSYVDSATAALNPNESVYAASTANIVGTYVSGVFTVTATGALSLDGTSPAAGARVLLKNQSTQLQNGIYDVTAAGSVGVQPVLTRSSDFNSGSNINAGDLVPVINGTVNTLTTWVQTNTVTSVGTDAIAFTQYTANPANNALKQTSQVIVYDSNGYGSGAADIKRFNTVGSNVGSDITYADSSTNGATFTINTSGIYAITYTDFYSAGSCDFGISDNTTSPNSAIYAINTFGVYLASTTTGASNFIGTVNWTGHLTAADVIRAHADSLCDGTGLQAQFAIVRLQ